MKTHKNLGTLRKERIIVELDKTAQKRIIGGVNSTEYAPDKNADIQGTYFRHDIIEE